MPIIYSAISEMTEHIHDVVVQQLAHKILQDMNPLINLFGKIYIDTGYSTTQPATDGQHNSIIKDNKLTVRGYPSVNPTNLKWEMLSGMHNTGQFVDSFNITEMFPTLFFDIDADVRLLEMCLPTTLTLEFEFELVSRDQAYTLPSQLYRRYMDKHVFTESIQYDYPVPNQVITLLYSIYKMRKFENKMTFAEYMMKYSNNLFSVNVNRADPNSRVELTIPKTLTNTIVTVEYTEDKPEEIKVNKSVNAYQTKFTLTAQYERTDMLALKYPTIIDNQLIAPEMVPVTKQDMPIKSLYAPHPNKTTHDTARSFIGSRLPEPIVMPFYDDWIYPRESTFEMGYRPFLIAQFLVDEEHPEYKTSIPLGEQLDEKYSLHDNVKDVLSIQKRNSFKQGALILIEVFWGNYVLDKTKLVLTDDLVLEVNCIDFKRPHRLVVYELTDVRYLDPEWYELVADKWPYFKVSDHISLLYSRDMITVNENGKLYDPSHNVLGGINDSHRPLRRIFADIIARNKTNRNR